MAKRPFKFQAMSVAELVQLRDEIQIALSGKIQMERDELEEKLTSWREWRTQPRRWQAVRATTLGKAEFRRAAFRLPMVAKPVGGSASRSPSSTTMQRLETPIPTVARWLDGCATRKRPGRTSRRSIASRNPIRYQRNSLTSRQRDSGRSCPGPFGRHDMAG